MLYLLYIRNGFIKKFPLNRKSIHLGRAHSNDLQIDEVFVSKTHVEIINKADHIEVIDLYSTNGVFTKKGKISKASVYLNQYFRIGHIKFFLKSGDTNELFISDKIHSKLNRILSPMVSDREKTTRTISHLYSEQLAEILNIGFGLPDLTGILECSKILLCNTLKSGILLIISRSPGKNKIISKWNHSAKYKRIIDKILVRFSLYCQQYTDVCEENGYHFCAFPFHLNYLPSTLLYINTEKEPISTEKKEFVEILSLELSIIDELIKVNRTIKKDKSDHDDFVTANPSLNNLLAQCKKISKSNISILIEGETGTGKELLARFIHNNSANRKEKYIALNCSAIPENLMEAELFGYEKGAFTDAVTQRKGKLELSSGGTLVLDEIGDMPLNLQAKLLRAVQEEQFYRLGGISPIKVKLRIVSMTNKRIAGLIKTGLFREDLYYRIAHIVLKLPPLRERQEDIIPLINHFVEKKSIKIKVRIKGFSNKTIQALEIYDWPGNIRELENEIEKLISLAENNDIIPFNMLKEEIKAFYEVNKPEKDSAENEKKNILKLLEENRWNKSIVADKMKISRTTLYNKLKRFSIIT